MDVVILNTGPDVSNITMYRTLGAYKIAHSVRQAGYTAQVIDHVVYFSYDQLVAALEKFVSNDTLVLGVSTTFLTPTVGQMQFTASFTLALNHITTKYPNLKLIFGGYGLSGLTLSTIQNIHSVVSKYGEDIFVDVLKHISGHGDEPAYTLENTRITSQTYKVYSVPIHVNFNIETDNFRFIKQDAILPSEALPVEISRGCIFKCKFCNHLLLGRGKLDYLRSFDLVKEEMMSNYENFGTTMYYVICDTFNDTEYKMKAWHDMITSLPFKIKFTCYIRADLLERFEDVPHILQETGMISTFHGIETLGEQASASIGKGWSGKRAREYIPELYHNIWKGKIHQTLSFIIGLPGDTRESIKSTAHWFNDNNLYNISWHCLGIMATDDTTSLIRNPSEFEKEKEKYGYFFPIKQDRGNWHNDYWSFKETSKFLEETITRINMTTNAYHGSWAVLQLLQLGFGEDRFLKENKKKWNRFELVTAKDKRLTEYIQLLMSL